MHTYVTQYRKLDRQATTAETRIDEYRRQAEACRWDQCRLAFEATDTKTYTQVAFAAEVGKSATTIKRQVAAWRTYGAHATRPSYTEAMAGVVGTTASVENGRKRLSTARAVLADPDVVAELLRDPAVRQVASRALRASSPAERDGRDGQRPTDDIVVAVGRYVRRLNADRREGRIAARDVRTVARRVRALADVLDRLATRAVDDDELEAMVSADVFGRLNGQRVAA